MIPAGLSAFKLTYEISPIILTGGIASGTAGVLPIIAITQAQDYQNGLLNGVTSTQLVNSVIASDIDSYWANFRPLPGSTLIDFQIGHYPFANQVVAANAIIAQPLRVSMLMMAPARAPNGYNSKLATVQAVRAALYQHASLGGTYTVATPSYLYTNCILTNLRDITDSGEKQPQVSWQWDFEQPLLTQQDAAQVQNSLTSKMTAQVPVQGDPPPWSGVAPTAGNPGSGIGPSLIPAAQSLGGASVGVSPYTSPPSP